MYCTGAVRGLELLYSITGSLDLGCYIHWQVLNIQYWQHFYNIQYYSVPPDSYKSTESTVLFTDSYPGYI